MFFVSNSWLVVRDLTRFFLIKNRLGLQTSVYSCGCKILRLLNVILFMLSALI